MMRILLLAACLGLAAYGSVVVMLYVRQDGLIFPRTDAPLADPSSTIGGMGRVALHTTDGLDLAAWYRPPSGDTGQEGMVVVYLHGNAGSLNGRRERFRDFAQAGFGVLGVEYRGYAGNPGRPDEDGLVRDAAAAMAFLKERGVAPARVVVYGESLGTNVAVRTALAYRVAGVILDSPYTSIADVAARRYPWMPVHTLIRNPFDTLSRVGALEVPVLVLRAAHDRTVPPDLSLRVFEAVRTRKEVWTSETATHATVLEHGGFAVACRFVTRVSPARI